MANDEGGARPRTAVLTISTRVARGDAEDRSGALLVQLAREAGCEVAATRVLSDDEDAIAAALGALVEEGYEIVFTTGGTGLTPDDVTPDATARVIDRPVPGIAEALRAESLKHTPHGMLSRELAGVAGRTLIVNLPGNPKAIGELFGVLAPVLEHAVRTIGGDSRH